MPLFPAYPVVINDGTDDRTFVHRMSHVQGNSLVSEFIEQGATSVAEAAKLVIKRDEASKIRSLCQLALPVVDAEGSVLDTVIINLTSNAKPTTPDATVLKGINLMDAVLGLAGFKVAYVDGLVE